jgi:hypothetical protein
MFQLERYLQLPIRKSCCENMMSQFFDVWCKCLRPFDELVGGVRPMMMMNWSARCRRLLS